MEKRYDAVLFDLDGTLTKSDPGIMAAAKYAIRTLGFPIPPESTMRKFIGPPLWYSFKEFCGMNEEQVVRAFDLYTQQYNASGVYENSVFPGIFDLFDALKANGVKIGLVTAKPEAATQLVIEHFKLAPYFDCVSAIKEEERSTDKRVLVENAVRSLNLPKCRVAMVGDTHYDANGARDAGVDFIGVLFGYGTREEMAASGCKVFAETAPDLLPILLPRQSAAS